MDSRHSRSTFGSKAVQYRARRLHDSMEAGGNVKQEARTEDAIELPRGSDARERPWPGVHHAAFVHWIIMPLGTKVELHKRDLICHPWRDFVNLIDPRPGPLPYTEVQMP